MNHKYKFGYSKKFSEKWVEMKRRQALKAFYDAGKASGMSLDDARKAARRLLDETKRAGAGLSIPSTILCKIADIETARSIIESDTDD